MGGRDDGTVTAELAVGLMGVGVILTGVLGVVVAGVARVDVANASAAGARAAARGEPSARVEEVSRRVAGGPVTVSVSAAGGLTTVTVSRRIRLTVPGVPAMDVRASAVALTEAVHP